MFQTLTHRRKSYRETIDAYNVFLAKMDGDNESQTFTDVAMGGNAPHTLTANGDVKQLKSNSGQGMGAFDGTGDYLSTSSGFITVDPFTTIPLTVEADVCITALGDFTIAKEVSASPGPGEFVFKYINSTNKLHVERFTGSGTNTEQADIDWTPVVDTWYRVAFSWKGDGDVYIALDGVGSTSTPAASTSAEAAGGLYAGSGLTGYMSQIRIEDGYARYTGDSTPDTTLINTNYTVVLIDFEDVMHSTNFIDKSDELHAVTAHGDAKIISSNKWPVPPAGLDTGMVKLDGTDDYVLVSNSSALDLGTASNGDFCIEGFFWFSDVSGTRGLFSCNESGTSNGWKFEYYNGDLRLWAGEPMITAVAWTPTAERWHHIALVREGSTVTVYVDGASQGALEDWDMSSDGSDLSIGASDDAGGNSFAGYIAAPRVSNSSRYSVPEFPWDPPLPNPWVDCASFTDDTYTVLLPNFGDEHGSTTITDSSSNAHTITANGGAVTIVPVDNGGVAYFDGTGDEITIADSEDWDRGSDDGTWETWAFNAASTGTARTLFERYVDASSYMRVYIHTDDTVRIEVQMDLGEFSFRMTINGTATLTAGWSHVRLSKSGSTWTLAVNGVSQGTGTLETLEDWAVGWSIGGGDVASHWQGYQDLVRFSTAARTASGFTPPNTLAP